jgi:hypothetical protein
MGVSKHRFSFADGAEGKKKDLTQTAEEKRRTQRKANLPPRRPDCVGVSAGRRENPVRFAVTGTYAAAVAA